MEYKFVMMLESLRIIQAMKDLLNLTVLEIVD